jgi:hypothetical protein
MVVLKKYGNNIIFDNSSKLALGWCLISIFFSSETIINYTNKKHLV